MNETVRKAALVVVDGWGIRDNDDPGNRDAFKGADTPYLDRLVRNGLVGMLETSGSSVGVTEDQMGNSEVGHLNIGAGRIVKQPIARIDADVESGCFFENEVLVDAVKSGNDLHFLGLVSDGGVHSAQRHLHALIELASRHDRKPNIHVFLDGRDTPPESAVRYISRLSEVCERYGGQVSTVSGRYYAMDRDGNWGRTKRMYDAAVSGPDAVDDDRVYSADSAMSAVLEAYERGETDEFVKPTVIEDGDRISDGDSAIFFNFRADRARQLTRMLNGVGKDWRRETELDIGFCTFTEYDESYDFPVAYPPTHPNGVLGEVVSQEETSQFRIAETEKYPHVTYFLNGGREEEFSGEDRVIVPSPDVDTYDEKPEMSAPEVTDEAVEAAGDYSLIVLNYANPDMVGHTGDYDAAVESIECVDRCLERLIPELEREGYGVVVTSDHGNADEMGSEADPQTKHTFNPTPLILQPDEVVKEFDTPRYQTVGELRDIAPTVLDIMDIETPNEMTGDSFLP